MIFDDLDSSIVDTHLNQFAPTTFVGKGGQKRVFRCQYKQHTWALPLILVSADPDQHLDDDDSNYGFSSEQAIPRLRREVAIMRNCDSPHLVKMGPIDVSPVEIDNLSILYFLEEFIEGEDLKAIIARGPLSADSVVTLATHVTRAIDALWSSSPSHQIIHRDLKPANIMRRDSDGAFVVLDIGLAAR